MNFSKKISLALCLSVALAFSIVSNSMAADCANAKILKIGASTGAGGAIASDNVIAIQCLSDTTWGTYTQFLPAEAIGDQALATALTALSLGKNVWIRTSAKTSGSILYVIYVNN